ncbi:flagellar hook-length control protein FliK [Vibrio tapetis subsp. quintayensis]|uniref:flagellar hook-length control protein FliK n=1 Tax=Vibrio tapetis TaxID=52443 RepID=UPI0025B431AA|nr:flagellar hook-length control protein FliK [Vibrio tapetis]MDN3682640.1 flagellar hook-length control protein FliK [Vibrio tapetis subsp. quintayensis]
MSHGSLSVSEVSKSSSLLGKANTSSPQDSESEGFIDILKSAFSSDSPSGEEGGVDEKTISNADGKTSKSAGEEAEASKSVEGKASSDKVSDGELSDGKAVDGKGINAETTEAKQGDAASKNNGKAASEESEQTLLKQDTNQVAGNTSNSENVDETMSEGNKLLERLDESNKALAATPQSSADGKGLPPETAIAAGVAAASQATPSAELAVAGSHASVGQGGPTVNKAAEGALVGTDQSKVPAVGKKSDNDAATQLAAIGAGGVMMSQAGGESVAADPTDTTKTAATDTDADVSVDGKAAAMLAGGVIGAGAATNETDKVAASASSEQIKWGAPDSGTQATSDAQLAATVQSTDGVDITQASIAAGMTAGAASMVEGESKVKGVATTQSVQTPGFEGQPLVASEAEEASVTYGEPMWASGNGELAAVEGSKKGIEASTAAKAATSAALAAQLHNPTSAQLPTDKAAASLASSGALSQDIAMQSAQAQSLAAANAVSSPLGATEQAKVISAAAASALVLGDGKGQGQGTKPGSGVDDKGDLAHQLAGVAGQQGLTAAQARGLEAQTVSAAQQPPLHLTRDAAGEQLAERVQMMLSKNLKNIDIRLDPPELGRMQIRMTMNNDVASVQFTVANQQTRDIVEQAMPRLREMLAQQGLQLADTSVQQQNAGQQQQSQYVAGQNGQQGRKNGDNDADGELGLDNPLEVNVDVTSNRDGISFYA